MQVFDERLKHQTMSNTCCQYAFLNSIHYVWSLPYIPVPQLTRERERERERVIKEITWLDNEGQITVVFSSILKFQENLSHFIGLKLSRGILKHRALTAVESSSKYYFDILR